LLHNSLKNVQDLFLKAPAVSPPWSFWDFVGLHGYQVDFFDAENLQFIFKQEEKTFMNQFAFFKPIYRLRHNIDVQKTDRDQRENTPDQCGNNAKQEQIATCRLHSQSLTLTVEAQ
jgi:hypothetical protein